MASSAVIGAVGVLGMLSPWLYGRYNAISVIVGNRPGNLPEINAFSAHQVLYEDTIRNCEHGLLEENEGFALLSCDPGRDWWNTVMGVFISSSEAQGDIYAYRYGQSATESKSLLQRLQRQNFPAGRDFHPLGIEYHAPSETLFAINHALPKGIEIFKLSPRRDGLIYERTFQHPMIYTPNSMYAISDHELFVTNDHFVNSSGPTITSFLETYLALPGGSVNYVNLKTSEVRLLARVPFANGVAMLNATHLAVASTSGVNVGIYEVEPVNKTLTLKQKIITPFFPDNLHVDADGTLLIAGHPFPPALDNVSDFQHRFALDGEDASRLPASDRPKAPSWVSEWDGNPEGKLRDLYVSGEYGTACTAARDVKRKVGIITGLYEKGILVFRE